MKQSDFWRTPKKIYEDLDKEFRFTFDPCPYKLPEWDGLEVGWGKSNFVNPPYSETEKWVRKAITEWKKGKHVVMLLRLDASTIWFRDLILPNAEIRLFDDRLHFVRSDGTSSRSDHASILAIFNPYYNQDPHNTLNLPIIYWRETNNSLKMRKPKKQLSQNETHSCLNCKKYNILPNEGKGMEYICDAEQKQEDAEEYPGKKYYDFWQFAACKPDSKNGCPKFKKILKEDRKNLY